MPASSVSLLVSLGTLILAGLGIWISRRTAAESNDTQENVAEYQLLRGVVESLNSEVTRLESKLKSANTKADRLNRELDTAQYNVLVLSQHVRQYLPELPFPELRMMNNG